MERIIIPEVEIDSNGTKVPAFGFGTAVYPFTASEVMKASILHAIKLGYRHLDTASVYNSEETLGEAIAEALDLGLINSRSQLFITSKLSSTDAHPDRVLPAIKATLQRLKLEYLDLYLIHQPVSLKPDSFEIPLKKDDLLPLDYKGAWEAMEECQKLGLSKFIGISNFSIKKIDQILTTANIPPAVNQ